MLMLTNRALLLIGGVAAVVSVVALTSGLAVGLKDDDPGDEAVNFRRSSGSTLVFSDNLAGAPSMAPSISLMPSTAPSSVPSLAPSSVPSDSPSSMPSEVPSDVPSLAPSAMPSLTPSDMPSDTPSSVPSEAPTGAPSSAPTVSAMPSFEPITKKFRLKIHWERGFYWQDERRERKWCMTCAKCNKLNGSDFSARDFGCRDSRGCFRGNQLYIRECGGGNADFRIENYVDGYLLRVDDTNNCVERSKDHYVTLQRCNPNEKRQKFQKFSDEDYFELRPVYDKTDMCMTQHHHPKSYEVCRRVRLNHLCTKRMVAHSWLLYFLSPTSIPADN